MAEHIRKRNAVMRINLRIRTPEVAAVLSTVQERERSMLIEHALCLFLSEHKDDHILKMLSRHDGDGGYTLPSAPSSTDSVKSDEVRETPVGVDSEKSQGIDDESYESFVVT